MKIHVTYKREEKKTILHINTESSVERSETRNQPTMYDAFSKYIMRTINVLIGTQHV